MAKADKIFSHLIRDGITITMDELARTGDQECAKGLDSHLRLRFGEIF